MALNCAISSSPAKNSIVFLKRAHLLRRTITWYDTHFAPMVEVKGLIHQEIANFSTEESLIFAWFLKGVETVARTRTFQVTGRIRLTIHTGTCCTSDYF